MTWEPGSEVERPGCCGDGTCEDDHGLRRRPWGVYAWLTAAHRDRQAERRRVVLERLAQQSAAAGVDELPTVALLVTQAVAANA